MTNTPIYEELLAELESHVQPPTNQQAIRKDFHLLIAALETDKIVITRDERLREILQAAALQVGELRGLILVNPDVTEEKIAAWLNRGAPAEKQRCLGYKLRKQK